MIRRVTPSICAAAIPTSPITLSSCPHPSPGRNQQDASNNPVQGEDDVVKCRHRLLEPVDPAHKSEPRSPHDDQGCEPPAKEHRFGGSRRMLWAGHGVI